MSSLIAPSILAADFANLQRDIEMVNISEADWFHIDIIKSQFKTRQKNLGCPFNDYKARTLYQNLCRAG